MANDPRLVKDLPDTIIEDPLQCFLHAGNAAWTRGGKIPVQAILDMAGGGATINVGNTTTLSPGSNATVVNSGNSTAVVLDFGIPAGSNGSIGVDGKTPGFRYNWASGGAGANGQIFGLANIVQMHSLDADGNDISSYLLAVTTGSVVVMMAPSINVVGIWLLDTPALFTGTVQWSGCTNLVLTGAFINGVEVFAFIAQRGPTGANGNDGLAATITVNNTFTGAPGSNATVVNVGNSTAAALDFTVPQGITGMDGINGTNGNDGLAATITVNNTFTGAPGSNATVVNVGNSTAAALDFTVPAGIDGTNGTNGTPAGANGELQWNNGGVFAAMNGSLTDGTNLTLPGGLNVNAVGDSWISLVGVGLNSLRFDNFGSAPGNQSVLALPNSTLGNATLVDLLGTPDAWVEISIVGTIYRIPAFL